MNISTHITRLAKTIALGLALVALAVPAAQAGDIVVDDWFRDANRASAQTGDIVVDDWFRDANRASAHAKTIPPANFRGDDWYRVRSRDSARAYPFAGVRGG